jgi:hypothetical protein
MVNRKRKPREVVLLVFFFSLEDPEASDNIQTIKRKSRLP